MTIIDGKFVSKKIREEIKIEVEELKNKSNIIPGLAVVILGEDGASLTYVNSKHKACKELGIYSQVHKLSSKTSQNELLSLIDELNNDSKIHGILVQLPLPNHIDENKIIDSISAKKDVDGFHPVSVGNLVLQKEGFLSCTPYGIIELLKHYEIDIQGKHAVVLGRSHIVGKPISLMLLENNATVTICHSKSKNIDSFTKEADIIICAVGKAKFLKSSMVKDGCVVIDVGIHRIDGKLIGDVDFEEISKKASYITPVPGGVGPMTITMLMKNTLLAAKKSIL